MKIEELLTKYFEGETSCEEERELRRFFGQSSVPEHLQMYRALFGFLESENQSYRSTGESAVQSCSEVALPAMTLQPSKSRIIRRRVLYTLSGLAATLLLLLAIAGVHRHLTAAPDVYVIIDGKQYSDPELARKQALAAFQSVSLSEEDVFSALFNE